MDEHPRHKSHAAARFSASVPRSAESSTGGKRLDSQKRMARGFVEAGDGKHPVP